MDKIIPDDQPRTKKKKTKRRVSDSSLCFNFFVTPNLLKPIFFKKRRVSHKRVVGRIDVDTNTKRGVIMMKNLIYMKQRKIYIKIAKKGKGIADNASLQIEIELQRRYQFIFILI